jgi:hypothetical protein
MKCSNELVLGTLRRVQLRQVPWHKKSMIFDFLQSIGLIEAKRPDSAVNGNFHPQIIALLTSQGRGEIRRLANLERFDDWENIKKLAYTYPVEAMTDPL